MHADLEREPGVDGTIAWIGPRPAPTALAAVLLVGTIGMIICGVQPVLLGALVDEHRLNAVQLGWGTTAEFLTLGAATAGAGAFLKPSGMRLKVALATLVAVAADALVAGQSGLPLIANRAVAGLAEGLLVWCAVCMVTRSDTPARWSGIFLTAQGVSQLIFAAAAPATIMKALGANGGFYALGAVTALALLAAPAIPDRMADLPEPDLKDGTQGGGYTPAAIASLACVFLIAAFSIGLFGYLAPLASQAHIDNQGLGLVVSIVLGTSIAGSALAAAMAGRMSYYAVFVICLVVNAAVLAVLATLPHLLVFALAAGVFGFFWLYFMPFQVPFVIEADPTRRIAVIVPGAQLFGAAAGPFLCSFFVSDVEARGVLWVCGVCFAAAFLICTALHLNHRRQLRLARALA